MTTMSLFSYCGVVHASLYFGERRPVSLRQLQRDIWRVHRRVGGPRDWRRMEFVLHRFLVYAGLSAGAEVYYTRMRDVGGVGLAEDALHLVGLPQYQDEFSYLRVFCKPRNCRWGVEAAVICSDLSLAQRLPRQIDRASLERAVAYFNRRYLERGALS